MHSKVWRAIKAQMKDGGSIDPSRPIFGKFDHSNVFWDACKRLDLVAWKPALVDADGKILASERAKARKHGPTWNITDKRGLTPHHIGRHTGATALVEAGVSLEDRMSAGGWDSVEAAQRYDHGDQMVRSRRALQKLR
jgi:hypothetical protein